MSVPSNCPRCKLAWDGLTCTSCGHYKGRKRAWFEIPEKDAISNAKARVRAAYRRSRGKR